MFKQCCIFIDSAIVGAGRNGEYDERVKDILKVLVLPGNRG